MLFKELKPNYPVYILDKQNITFTQGKATNVSFPRMEMTQGGTQMVVDVSVEANGNNATYSIPEHLSTTFAGNLVLSTDKDALVKEIEAMKQTAEQVINSVDRQKVIAEKAAALLVELNPAFREKKETEERFNKIESSVADIKDILNNFIKEFKN